MLCKKHETSNPQNKSKVFNKEPCKRFRPGEFEDHCRTSKHMNAVSAEMLQRDSVFQRTLDERKSVAEDVLLKVFTATYWIMKKELPNPKIKSHVQAPELTCIPGSPGLVGFGFCLLLHRLAVRISLLFHIFLKV